METLTDTDRIDIIIEMFKDQNELNKDFQKRLKNIEGRLDTLEEK